MPMVYYEEFFPDLHFQVRVFDDGDKAVECLTCAATDLKAAHYAYDNAVSANPKKIVRLMHWGRIIRETHRTGEIKGFGQPSDIIPVQDHYRGQYGPK